MTDNDWPGVHRAVEERRISLRLSQAKLAQLAGVSRTKIGQMAQGIPLETRVKRIGLSRALQWSDDSIDRLLGGEAPLSVEDSPVDPNAAVLDAVEAVGRRLDRLGTKIDALGHQIVTLVQRIEDSDRAGGPAPRARGARGLAAAAHDGQEPAPRPRTRPTPRGGRAEQGDHAAE